MLHARRRCSQLHNFPMAFLTTSTLLQRVARVTVTTAAAPTPFPRLYCTTPSPFPLLTTTVAPDRLRRVTPTPTPTLLGQHRRNMSGEEEKAQSAGPAASGEKTIFQKIIDKEIPATLLHEDDKVIAFKDVSPQAPVHFLVVPKKLITMVETAEEQDGELIGHMILVAKQVAKAQGLSKGYRLVFNNGVEGCQSVYHLHLHVLGGKQLSWPPGV